MKNEQKHSVCVYKWQGFITLSLLLVCIKWAANSHFFFQFKMRHESYYDECWASSLSLHFKGIVSRGNECCFFIITHSFTLHRSCMEKPKTSLSQSQPICWLELALNQDLGNIWVIFLDAGCLHGYIVGYGSW